MLARVGRLFAAVLVGIAASTSLHFSPASAAVCPAGTGVTVVVGSGTSCDTDGGGTAKDNFGDAGHTLTYVDRQPGFVCRVDGAPSSATCVDTPAGSYWALWWSDGTSGSWTYSDRGVGTLKVPQGGYVGFVYGNGKTPPGVAPISRTEPTATAKPTATSSQTPSTKPTAKPSRKPTTKTTKEPAVKPTATTGASAAAPTTSASPSATAATPEPTATAAASPSATAEPTAPESSNEVERTSSNTDDGGSGSLGWVAGALVVALIGGMGAVLWRRRTAGGSS